MFVFISRNTEFVKTKIGEMLNRMKTTHFRTPMMNQLTRNSQRFFTITIASMVTLSPVCLIMVKFSGNIALCADDKNNLDITELANSLKNRLKAKRENLKIENIQIPPISVRLLKYDDLHGNPVETQVLELSFNPTDSTNNVVCVAKHWLSVVNPHQSHIQINSNHIKKIVEFYSNSSAAALPIVSEDRKCSMTIMKSVSPVRGTNKLGYKVSVTLFKDGGFTLSDVDKISKGYIEGFSSSSGSNSKQSNTATFSFNPKAIDAPANDGGSRVVIESEGSIPGIFNSTEFDGWLRDDTGLLSNGLGRASVAGRRDTIADENSVDVSSADEKSVAVRALECLGVEVFDRSTNALLTWDSLAGYSVVKKHIQDTIVNALQHPDVYDAVATKTRVVFESNRPKAVLLEGPPGTGKTLTARILASQCDRPLVVIRLESVVSKWFGDSEKKLSQIFDACDSLDGAIIFVDEIDSLAQSRDNEGGIHEVSKRILSVLLQRIEGFHGKGRSVLVCATNRKQDLDSALVSRFDLVIPYALPDYSTRYEILRRYAKQFESSAKGSEAAPDSKDAFSALSVALDGMSCRAIKEVCEQAERLCASRLVTARKEAMSTGNGGVNKSASLFSFATSGLKSTKPSCSEVPTLDDYLECVQHRGVTDKPSVNQSKV